MSGATGAGGGGRQPIAASSVRPVTAATQRPLGSSPQEATIVRVADASYQNIRATDGGYIARDFMVTPLPGAGTEQVIGTIQVPPNMVLDISEISFVHIVPVGAGVSALPDYFHGTSVTFIVMINGRVPWDVATNYAPAIGFPPAPGWNTLNQNIMASWSDTPVHLIAGSNTRVDLSYRQLFAMAVLGGDGLLARVRGRWIPLDLFRNVTGAKL